MTNISKKSSTGQSRESIGNKGNSGFGRPGVLVLEDFIFQTLTTSETDGILSIANSIATARTGFVCPNGADSGNPRMVGRSNFIERPINQR